MLYVNYMLGNDLKEVKQMLKCEKCIHKKICIDGANYKNAESCRNYINEKDFLPVKHGHWIQVDKNKCECSNCGIIVLIAVYPHGDKNYCPNCGAKKDGGDDNA